MSSLVFPLLLRKQILAGLLATSCIAVFLLLLLYPDQRHSPLESLSQADSLIVTELTRFHIGRDRVRTFEYHVTDGFTRKRYVVTVPQGLSQTYLHAELNRKLREHRVDTVAFVNVPEREMKVLILYNNKIIRTLELRTDTGRT